MLPLNDLPLTRVDRALLSREGTDTARGSGCIGGEFDATLPV